MLGRCAIRDNRRQARLGKPGYPKATWTGGDCDLRLNDSAMALARQRLPVDCQVAKSLLERGDAGIGDVGVVEEDVGEGGERRVG